MRMQKTAAFAALVCVASFTSAVAHGPGHSPHGRRGEAAALAPGESAADAKGKTLAPLEEARWWSASLTAGWESRHVHYGVDETGKYGAFTTELSVSAYGFTVTAWGGFGTGNDFQEWDFTISYELDLGPVFLMPGYNFRYTPSFAEHGHEEHEHSHHDHHHHDHGHHEHHHSHDGHAHKTYGHEIFLVAGTTALPYVTPTAMVLTDLNNLPGTLLQFRLDSEIPVVRDVLSLHPYTLLAINLGYNTDEELSWNNWQFGAEAVLRLNDHVSIFGGAHYSVAMTALRHIGQDNVFWANAGVRLSY